MIQKITGEAPFQVLATNFSIGPSQQDYTLQISANGTDYSDLFTVSAGQTKMVTNVANGSYYRLKNNESEVTINWRTQCNDGGSGGGSGSQGPQGPQGGTGAQGPQGPAGSGSQGGIDYNEDLANYGNFITSDDSTPIGFVIPIGDDGQGQTTDYTGLKYDSGQATIVEYHLNDEDPSNPYWEETFTQGLVTEGQLEELATHTVELSTSNPADFTENDIDALNSWFAEVEDDSTIAERTAMVVDGQYYHFSYGGYDGGDGGNFGFVYGWAGYTEEIELNFASDEYDSGELYKWSENILRATDSIPEGINAGDVYAIVAPEQAPASPDGQTVYGGNLADFEAQVGDNNDEIWVKTYDDTGHTEWTDLGYFTTDKNGLVYYDYQGDKEHILADFPEGSWSENWGGVYVRREGENVYFYVGNEAQGVFFDPDVSMNFDIVGDGTLAVYQAVTSSTLVLSAVSVTWTDGTSVDYNDDGTFEQIVTDSSQKMYITINDTELFVDGVELCSYETYGNLYPLWYNSTDDEWTFYSTDGQTVLDTIADRDSTTVLVDGTNVYFVYTGGVLTVYTSESKGWQAWNGDMYAEETVVSGDQLAKLSDIPEVPENRLVPRIDDGNWNDGKWLRANGWNNQSYWSDGPREVPGGTWDGQSEGKAVVSTNEYASTYGWSSEPVVQSSDVLRIVKITVSDYEDLVTNDETDPNTLYLTYEPQV